MSADALLEYRGFERLLNDSDFSVFSRAQLEHRLDALWAFLTPSQREMISLEKEGVPQVWLED